MNKTAGVINWIKQRLRNGRTPAQPDVKPSPLAMREVESSNIRAIGYSDADRRLQVQFHGGGLYQFDGVPLAAHQGIMSAESKGRHFNKEIKGQYDTKHLNRIELHDVLTRGRQAYPGWRGRAKLREQIAQRTGKQRLDQLSQADLQRLHKQFSR